MGTRRWFVPIAGMLTGTAWLALWLWEQSPYGRYLDHPRWTEIGIAGAICRALPAGDIDPIDRAPVEMIGQHRVAGAVVGILADPARAQHAAIADFQ